MDETHAYEIEVHLTGDEDQGEDFDKKMKKKVNKVTEQWKNIAPNRARKKCAELPHSSGVSR